MTMCGFGNFGAIALLLLKLQLQLTNIYLLLPPLLLQQGVGTSLSFAVRIRRYFLIWLQCVVVMYPNKTLMANHFSGKSYDSFFALVETGGILSVNIRLSVIISHVCVYVYWKVMVYIIVLSTLNLSVLIFVIL